MNLLAHDPPGSFDQDLPRKFRCPEGTTFNRSDSTAIKLVCDVDSGGTPEQSEVFVIPTDELSGYYLHESELPPLINSSYPEWYRQNGGGDMATNESHHYYYKLLGHDVDYPSYETEGLGCSSYYLRGGYVYFAHNHPTRELYYIISGTADWYIGDEGPISVEPGYLMIHPPYIPHGMTNTTPDDGELHALVCSWETPEDPDGVTTTGGLPANPCLVEHEATARPDHVEPVCPAGE
ncbi:MAG: cupin domain-containing protein [Spirulina sp. SIO3F2]|nr:cupin domain-containing protein [Spirulina sp. SIO3F2]